MIIINDYFSKSFQDAKKLQNEDEEDFEVLC